MSFSSNGKVRFWIENYLIDRLKRGIGNDTRWIHQNFLWALFDFHRSPVSRLAEREMTEEAVAFYFAYVYHTWLEVGAPPEEISRWIHAVVEDEDSSERISSLCIALLHYPEVYRITQQPSSVARDFNP